MPESCADHCDIGAGEGVSIRSRNRTAAGSRGLPDHYRTILDSISHLVLYNSGSVLNPREMPPDFLDEIFTFARSSAGRSRPFARLARGFYQATESLRRILAVAGERITVRPILGIESSDDRIRNEILRKAMPRATIIRVFRDLGAARSRVWRGPHRTRREYRHRRARNHERDLPWPMPLGRLSFALQAGAEHGVHSRPESAPVLYWRARAARFSRITAVLDRNNRCRGFGIAQLAVQSVRAQTNVFIGWQDEGHDC